MIKDIIDNILPYGNKLFEFQPKVAHCDQKFDARMRQIFSMILNSRNPVSELAIHFISSYSDYKLLGLTLKIGHDNFGKLDLEDLRQENKFNYNKHRYFCNSVQFGNNLIKIEFRNLQFGFLNKKGNFTDLEIALCEQQDIYIPIIIAIAVFVVLAIIVALSIFFYLFCWKRFRFVYWLTIKIKLMFQSICGNMFSGGKVHKCYCCKLITLLYKCRKSTRSGR